MILLMLTLIQMTITILSMYGVYRSSCYTASEHRESSFLNTGQFMDIEVYCANTEDNMCHAQYAAMILGRLVLVLRQYLIMTGVTAAASWYRYCLAAVWSHLLFFVAWPMCHFELSFLKAEELAVYAQCHHCFLSEVKCCINKISR